MKNQKSADFYRGAMVQAIYRPTGVPDYDGNPLIESLPSIMTAAQAAKRLSYFPEYSDSMRQLDSSVRYHLIRKSSRFFTPLGVHIDLERRISCALRMSLIQRNPLDKDYLNGIEQKVSEFASDWVDQYNLPDAYFSSYAPGFNFVGISGQGKSQSLNRILGTLPQVIFHSNYKDRELIETQLVWLKLDCPFDGSIKALCLNFFQAVDNILGTDYLKTYAGRDGRRTATQMIPSIANVAANQHLGILVIDEIQRLNLAASGGRNQILNFFVQLVNKIGVAVVLVGTFSALNVFSGNFSQMRRGTGQGDLVWDRMSYDKNWDRFIKLLWKYQFTRQKISLEEFPQLSRILYDECQGITDLAIKAYMFAQERAIETKKEVINASIIRSAARDKFQIIRPAIEALRNKQKEAIKVFEDAYPEFLEKYMQGYADWSKKDTTDSPPPITITGEIVKEPEIKAIITQSFRSDDGQSEASGSSSKENIKVKRKKGTRPKAGGVLPTISENNVNHGNHSVYNALVELGYTSPDDDLGFNSHVPQSGGEEI